LRVISIGHFRHLIENRRVGSFPNEKLLRKQKVRMNFAT
jgi:hypothetical protein